MTIGSEAKISTPRCVSDATSLPSTIAAGRSGLASSISYVLRSFSPVIEPAAKLGAIIDASTNWPDEEQIHQPLRLLHAGAARRQIEPRILRPGEINHRAQQRLIQQQQHKRPRHPQVDEQLALQHGIFENEHKKMRIAEFGVRNVRTPGPYTNSRSQGRPWERPIARLPPRRGCSDRFCSALPSQ